MVYIGLDDTDSLDGGCTTYVAFRLAERLIGEGYSMVRPWLVRLNPNVPWKTRGNGALALRVLRGGHMGEVIGRYHDLQIREAIGGRPTDVGAIAEIADQVIDELSVEGSDPGCVVSEKGGPGWFYWRCVRWLASRVEAEDLIEKMGALKVKEGRGLIGALAAISWPRIERTFELICYRDPRRWGTKRAIDEGTVKRIELEFPETFDSFDLESSVQRIAPSSPCPVLYGIRGIKPDALKEAKKVLRGEEGEGWMIFESNQGTDDHLQMRKIGEIEEIQSVIVDGLVSSPPWRIRGGHLFFEISDDSGRIECAAFEPTKRFREVLSRLEVGDRIRAYGGVKKSTINLEKIEIIETVPIYEREDPSCPRCARRMKSMGTGKGYRCRCGWRVGEAFALLSKRRRPEPGFYEVPIRARKHLSKPIKLMVS